MARIDIDSLTKTYSDGDHELVAVDDLDITIRDGEFLVLVGPSGCGKSTTLRCIAGLERVTEGEIELDGTPVTDKKPKNRDMAMVFQNYALYPHMTVRENMSFGLEMTTDLSDDRIREKVEQTAEMMDIPDLLDHTPSELSGGQQQRVALGRAIVRDPEVFLMDEPLSNLDAKLRSTMRTELQSLQQELDVTTIYVTHDQTEAMTMGDRIAVLNDGELQQIGTPLDCYHRPENEFVAGFIGSPSMNFLDVTRRDRTLVHDAFEYRLSDEYGDGVRDGSLTLGIRPEDIEVAERGGENVVETTVSVVEPMGGVTNLYFELAGERYTATVSGEYTVSSGESIGVVFPEDKIHLFDAETGEAVKNREYASEDAPVSIGEETSA